MGWRAVLGGGLDGTLAEFVCLPEASFVRVPEHLSFEEAATLPCAALTASNALNAASITAGQTVLLLGTGGVSIFGLQFAKLMEARAIITSSSDEKLQRARELGADETVNYRTYPNWQDQVRELTGGVRVDHVLEVGGAGTLEKSLRATRVGGTISLIGILTEGQPAVALILLNAQVVRGIYAGSVEIFEAMNCAIEVAKLKPELTEFLALGSFQKL